MRGLRIIAYLFVAGLVAVVSYFQYQGLNKTREKADKSTEALEQKRIERDVLRAKVRDTEAHVKHLQSDPLEVEAAIRDKKKYLRPGEVSIQIKELPGAIDVDVPVDLEAGAENMTGPDTAVPAPPSPDATSNEQTPIGATTAPGQ